ncbi:MAG: glycosyltransferase family 2 protein [Actinomycetota bacterium]
MTSSPDVSVIIPALNAEGTLPAQLEALAGQKGAPPFEVVVADNGSTDRTREIARSFEGRFADLRVVDASARRGPNHARNIGAQAASGDLLLYCDADDVVSSPWVSEMVTALGSCDLVGGSLDQRTLNEVVEDPRWVDGSVPPPGRDLEFLPWAASSSFGIRKNVLLAVDGWDETYPYFMGGDDVELTWRCQLAGYRLGFAGSAVVHYRIRRGYLPLSRRAFHYGMAGPLLYRRFRTYGAPRRSLRIALASWWWSARTLPRMLVTPPFRPVWLRWTAISAGRAWGSLRFRALYL